jgi:hypothetical protein
VTGAGGEGPPGGGGAPSVDAALLALVVHDLRSPLTSMLGWADLLAERAATMTPSMRARAYDGMRSAATQQAALLDALAALGALAAAGGDPGGDGPVDLADVAGGPGPLAGPAVAWEGQLPAVWGPAVRVVAVLALLRAEGRPAPTGPPPLRARVEGDTVAVEVDTGGVADADAGGFVRAALRSLLAGRGGSLRAGEGPGGGAVLVARLAVWGPPDPPPVREAAAEERSGAG